MSKTNCFSASATLAVHKGRAGLVIFTLGSPHLLEYAHRREIKTLTILRSGGATTVIFMVDSTKVVISLVMHSQ